MKKELFILGTRGVPAQHGGFETFAEKLSLFLVAQGWSVTVYCQEEGKGASWESEWRGVKRIHIPVSQSGAKGTVLFDWYATKNALNQHGLFLTLGYNTAIFNTLQRVKGQVNIINMDGIEWRRDKWGGIAKAWFWLNERIGCWVGNHLIADHPRIEDHLSTRVSRSKITMIPYGGDDVASGDLRLLERFSLNSGGYSIIIARPEPENSILEMVRAFSSKERGHILLVLGNYSPEKNPYHRLVMDSASAEVVFPGAIYEPAVIQALRFHCRFYLHGHRVGGTNPSLVEALGANCAIVAHDNPFNRWVAEESAKYFQDEAGCAKAISDLLEDSSSLKKLKTAAHLRFNERFTWSSVLKEYEDLLDLWYEKTMG
ncbi:DUF1972 domain-containing protein [Pseudomonas guariconensis]|uniref:DUF1972 domain-containing protein n=1 Tax=Pseudomonas guariconensis TaxID=1288410 RepID=UPI0018AAD8F9|nr:DUF1972 domain-containing protein [Pseudomonas guariconensis]MBF8723037.1 DUF1972 domain-containing protein [Pseudomonas guariconensis]MBF8742359.1 DUF1972 domain-containing protein [Pseudomonas guariconensis]MBF8751530.1 DUF1972 domain-containing protein [Pseudomonas guariconensis]